MPDHDHEAVGDDSTDEVMPVEVLGLQIDPSSGLSIVLLGRLDLSDRVLPISSVRPKPRRSASRSPRSTSLDRRRTICSSPRSTRRALSSATS